MQLGLASQPAFPLPKWVATRPALRRGGGGGGKEEGLSENRGGCGLINPGPGCVLVHSQPMPGLLSSTQALLQFHPSIISGGFVPDRSGLLSITKACLAALEAQSVPVQEVSVISHSSAIWFLMCEAASTQF